LAGVYHRTILKAFQLPENENFIRAQRSGVYVGTENENDKTTPWFILSEAL
jgi:hypothetical protein